jgi:tetratricopeptide (TPR) repeat protein
MQINLPSVELGGRRGSRGPLDEGRIALLAGDFERAGRLADTILSSEPEHLEAWILKGRSFVCRYDPTAALDCYEHALAIHPGSTEAWRRKAFAHRLAGQTEDAIAAWRRAIEIDPDDRRALMDMGAVLDEVGDYSGAISCYRRVLAIDPNDRLAKESIQLNERILGRLEQAATHGGQR